MLGLPSICWTHLEGLEQWNAWAAGSCLQEQMAQFPGSDYGGSRSDVCVCVSFSGFAPIPTLSNMFQKKV